MAKAKQPNLDGLSDDVVNFIKSLQSDNDSMVDQLEKATDHPCHTSWKLQMTSPIS